MCFSRSPRSHLQRSSYRTSKNCSPRGQAAEMETSLVLGDRDTKISYSMENPMRQLTAICRRNSKEDWKTSFRHQFRHKKCCSTVPEDVIGEVATKCSCGV